MYVLLYPQQSVSGTMTDSWDGKELTQGLNSHVRQEVILLGKLVILREMPKEPTWCEEDGRLRSQTAQGQGSHFSPGAMHVCYHSKC